jgi:Beta-lactamase enzyme family
LYERGEGYQLTLREAAKIMITESDNTAALAIYDKLKEVMPLDSELLSFIDIDFGVNGDASVKLGPESYSNILKCLYFSCYTNRDSSQEILGYLTNATDSSRLKLYLKDDVTVAHKIGTYDTKDSNVQSDCGIFYVPSRNYLLCIMVKGNDPEASRTIGDISKLTYDFISAKNR